jgi:ATP-dependent protease HslVU (ClpYQ) peptidase subunit
VTTCIAAITGRAALSGQPPDILVTASDTKLSFGGEYSAEGSVKLSLFHKDWGAMVAGSDISQSAFVLERAKTLLRGKSGSLQVVMSAVKKSYQEQLQEVITDDLLSRYQMTIAEFKKKGKAQLLPEVYAEISLRTKIYNLGSTFLVYGVDDRKIGHIFTVRNPGKSELHDKPGFWAIGQGASSALSMMSALKQVRGRTPFEETIYNVLASKYFSEGASDVGRETYLFIKTHGSGGYSYRARLEDDIRAIWEKEGKPRTNPEAVTLILNGEFHFFPRTRRSNPQRVHGQITRARH